MTNEVLIRPAARQDEPALYELMLRYIVDFYQQPEPEKEQLISLFRHLLEQSQSGLQFVAEKEGQLVGFATLYFTFSTLKAKKTAILNDLFVLPEVRGNRVGEKLFKESLAFVRENGYASMSWETAKENEAAQSFYRKMGGQQSKWLVYEME